MIYDQALIGDGKTTSCLIGDHLTMLIGDQADWSLIGGGKTGPKSEEIHKLLPLFSHMMQIKLIVCTQQLTRPLAAPKT